MKHLIILFTILLSLQSCSQNKNKEISYLNSFYKEYSNSWNNDKQLNELKKNNFSKELFNSLKQLILTGQLDYDPIINAQDLNDYLLKSLNIKYQKDDDTYEVSYLDSYNKTKVFIYLKLTSNEGSFLITDIKVNNIKSLVELNKKNSKKSEENSGNSNTIPQIIIKASDLIIKTKAVEHVFKNLIRNEMSISTSLGTIKNNNFSLIYELNGSTTKIKEEYNFIYSANKLNLIYKEQVKFSSKGTATNRIYFDNYNMENRSYENIESLGKDLVFTYSNKKPIIYLYNKKKVPFGNISIISSSESYFIDYPNVKKENLIIENTQEANDVAYYLEQLGTYDESIFLLNEIIKMSPDRVVAYLNLGDANWGLNNKKAAIKAYEKYISIMKLQNKDLKKIPKRVYDRIK